MKQLVSLFVTNVKQVDKQQVKQYLSLKDP